MTHISEQGRQLSKARKKPHQQRARQTVEAILQASAEMFAKLGFAGTTTNKIAARAGVSIGSLYQYFPNKLAILAALKKAHQQDIFPIIDDFMVALGDPNIAVEEALRTFLTHAIRQHELRPDLTRALTINQAYLNAEAESDKSDDAVWLQKTIDALSKRDEFRARNLELICPLLVVASESMMRWIAHDAPASLEKSALIDEAAKMISRYLEPSHKNSGSSPN